MSFEISLTNLRAIERTMKALESKARGDQITHPEMERLLGCRRDAPDNRYYSLFSKVKKRLLKERNILMANLWGVGYELSEAPRQLGEARIQGKRIRRKIAYTLDVVERLPNDELNFEMQRQKCGIEEQLRRTLHDHTDRDKIVGLILKQRGGGHPLPPKQAESA